MTMNTSDLKDGHLPLVERIELALRRVTNGEGTMRVPVEATDPDIVLSNCRDYIAKLEAQLDEARLEGRREYERHANTSADLKRYVDGHAFVVRERDGLAAQLATLRDEEKAGDERFEKWEAEAMEREAAWRSERAEWIGLVLHHWANRAPVSKTTLDAV